MRLDIGFDNHSRYRSVYGAIEQPVIPQARIFSVEDYLEALCVADREAGESKVVLRF